MKAADIAAGLKARRQGTGWTARCPAHDDKTASLSIGIGTEKPVVVKCHAGCDQDAVIAALKDRGLWPEDDSVEVRDEGFRKVADWTYETEACEPKLRVVRTQNSSGKKQFYQEHYEKGEWIRGGTKDDFAPLYYTSYKPHHNVFLVEGEKCADALKKLHLEATATPGGASGWRESFAKYFAGKSVCILPDNDGPGLKYAEAALADILKTGAHAFICPLPNLEPKEDIADWIARRPVGESVEQTRDELLRIVKSNKPKTIFETMGFQSADVGMDSLEEIQQHNARHLMRWGMRFLDEVTDGIMRTDLVVATARSGSGKTQLAMNTAKHAVLAGKRVAFFALEASRDEIENRMTYNLAMNLFLREKAGVSDVWVDYGAWMKGDERMMAALHPYVNRARNTLKPLMKNFYTFYRGRNGFDVNTFTKIFSAVSKEVDLVIVDHLNYFDVHDGKFRSEHQVTSDIMKRMRDAVLLEERPVLLVVHLRKNDMHDKRLIPDMEDLHGSSDIFKIATKVIIMARSPNSAGRKYQATYMRVAKDRFGGSSAQYCAEVNFNIPLQTYESEYLLGRLKKGDTEWEPVEGPHGPYWYGKYRGAYANEGVIL